MSGASIEGQRKFPRLSGDEKKLLLQLARQAIKDTLDAKPILPLDLKNYSENLRSPGASFVTLTIQNQLRGCIGALEPYQPLAEDVREHAIAAAFQDFRFSPLTLQEFERVTIEISRILPSQIIDYSSTDELIKRIAPFKDGVILQDGLNRATFLPQVWEKLPEPEMFLSHLCQKMGAPPDLWRRKKLTVKVYQVEEFHE